MNLSKLKIPRSQRVASPPKSPQIFPVHVGRQEFLRSSPLLSSSVVVGRGGGGRIDRCPSSCSLIKALTVLTVPTEGRRDLARSGGTSKMVWRQNVDFLLVTHLGPSLLLLSRHSWHPTSLFCESHSFLSLTQIENAFDVDEA